MQNNDMTLEALLSSLEEPIEKSASEDDTSTPALAVEEGETSVAGQLEGLLTKKASDETTSEESIDMNKEAQETGIAIADAVLGMLKEADEGSNAVIQQTEELVDQHDDATELTPREGNTVTETLKGIVARGAADGAVHPDKLALNAVAAEETGKNGPDLETSDDNEVENVESDLGKEAHEKLAATAHLMDGGYSYEDAVSLVKEAAEEIEAEDFEQVKLATVGALVEEGLDVESALELTKEAMETLAWEMDKEAATGKAFKGVYKAVKKDAKTLAGHRERTSGVVKKVMADKDLSKAQKAKTIAKLTASGKVGPKGVSAKANQERAKAMRSAAAQYAGAGATSLAAIGGAGYAANKGMKKAAALEGLVESGYSVEDALFLLDD